MENQTNDGRPADRTSTSNIPEQKHHRVCRFFVQRHAFFVALAMSMLFSEREQNGRSEGVPRAFIYLHLGALLTIGSVMSFGKQKSLFAVLGAGFTTFFCVTSHLIQQTKLKQWLVTKMIFHDVAIVGVYLILASRQTENLPKKFKLLWLYPYGRYCLAAFFIFLSFQLNRDDAEQSVLPNLFPFGFYLNLALSTVFMICGLLLASDWNIQTVCHVLIGGLMFYIAFVQCAIYYWNKKRRVEFWNQMDLIGDDCGVLLCLMLMST